MSKHRGALALGGCSVGTAGNTNGTIPTILDALSKETGFVAFRALGGECGAQ
jgi:hypothetical protein